jgi:adenosylcobinamide kinase/adenosylcobinamide-phosphate guanylyltransferase
MASDTWLITGGGRSGKSSYAEKLASEKAAEKSGVLYIATGKATDEEMEERIARHRAARPRDWVTWERCEGFADIGREFAEDAFGTILLDCVANLLMGILFEEIPNADDFSCDEFDRVEQLATKEIEALCAYAKKYGKRLIIVTNEIGMGIIPATRYSRYYRDALGRINQYAAKASDKAVLMVAGLPLELK